MFTADQHTMSLRVVQQGTQLVHCNPRALVPTQKSSLNHDIRQHWHIGRHAQALRFRQRRRKLSCQAQQRDPFRTRLAVNITSVPYLVDSYFQDSFWRKALWSGSAFSAGYYAANTVSLSFGALAINDVVAAAVTVGFCEVVSIAFWSAESPGLGLLFLNCFKLGVIAALIADAFKLAG